MSELQFRQSQVAISPMVRWALVRIARAQSLSMPPDQLADEVLTKWVTEHYPKLVDIWNRRGELDKEADKEAGQTKVPF